MFNKAVTRPSSGIVRAEVSKFQFGLDLDMDSVIRDLEGVKNSRYIKFFTENSKVGNMLNTRNVSKFRMATKGIEKQIEISKRRKANRMITIRGDGAYSIYLLVRNLLGM